MIGIMILVWLILWAIGATVERVTHPAALALLLTPATLFILGAIL